MTLGRAPVGVHPRFVQNDLSVHAKAAIDGLPGKGSSWSWLQAQTTNGLLPGHLSELFKGKRNINARLAIKLEKELDVSAEYWLGLQSAYDLAIARKLEHA